MMRMSETSHSLSIDEVKLENNSSVKELSFTECRNDEKGSNSYQETFMDFILPKSWKLEDKHCLSLDEVKQEDYFSEEEASFSECKNDEECSKSFQDLIIEVGKICKTEDTSLHESLKSEDVPLPSIDKVKLEDNSSVEELSLNECRNCEDDMVERTNIWTSDFILPKKLKSEDDHSLSIAEVKLENDSSKDESLFSEFKNDEEDRKIFQEHVIEGEKIWNREDFSLPESCVLHCDEMQLNENTFPGYGKAIKETNMNNCQRCENSSMDGSNLNFGIPNFISENYNNGMCDDKNLEGWDHNDHTEPGKKTSFEADIDDECETTHKENLEQAKGVYMCNYTALEHSKLEYRFESKLVKFKIHKCQLCQYETSHEGSLEKHMNDVHLKLNNFKCQQCEFTTSNKNALQAHMKGVHLKVKTHKCPHCAYATAFKSALQTHVNRVHLKLKNHKCHMCDFAATQKRNLQVHINGVHLKLKNHKCHMCEFATANKSSLQIHIERVHLKLKNRKCLYCEYATTENRHLKSHMNSVHLNLRNHKCHMCDYAALEKHKLELHIDSVHLKLKNHKCHICDFATNFKQSLKTHIDRVHLKLKNYQCHMCEYAASQKRDLSAHIKRVHL